METLAAIKKRRSVRVFSKKRVPEKMIRQVVESGLRAPSSKNAQPWKIFVVQNKKVLQSIGRYMEKTKYPQREPSDPVTGEIRRGYVPSVIESGKIISGCPVLLVIENTCPFSRGRSWVRKSKFFNGIYGHDSEMISLGCAIQNMHLMATDLGLGTVIIADVVVEEDKIKKILGIKGDLIAAMPLGFPAYWPPERDPDYEKYVIEKK